MSNIHKIHYVVAVLMMASLACNLPIENYGDQVVSPSEEIRVETTDVTQESDIVSPTNVPVDVSPTQIETNLPTITMEGGTGYLFLSQEITSGSGADRDIWWNAVEFIGAKYYPTSTWQGDSACL